MLEFRLRDVTGKLSHALGGLCFVFDEGVGLLALRCYGFTKS